MIPGSSSPLLLPVAAGGGALVIGQAFQGGYYAGTITYEQGAYPSLTETTYNLIVAPKATGEASTRLKYKTSLTCDGAASTETSPQSRWDGYFNTYTSVLGSSTAHPAANYCQNLSIDGYSDWYLPTEKEVDVAYKNLLQLADWQSGGSEDFTTGTVIINGSPVNYSIYWTSFGDGCENTGVKTSATAYVTQTSGSLAYGYPKTDEFFVRAIRRVAV